MAEISNSKFKGKYKVPYTLDKHFGEAPVQLQTKSGNRFGPADLTLRPFLVTLFAVMIYLYAVFASPLSPYFLEGSLPGIILVSVGYAGLIYFALREIAVPGLYGYNVIVPFIDYTTSKRNKLIRFGNEQPYIPVSNLIGMHEPDDQGHLYFNTGNQVGKLFQITGTASNNTFEIDRQAAIADFSDFLRQLPETITVSFVTNTGGQNVNAQLNHLLDLFDRTSDAQIQAYITEEIKELADYVQDNFVTLHQYMLIIGDDTAAFKNGYNIIREFIDRNGYVISSLTIPSKKHNYEFFQNIYGGIQNEKVLNYRLKAFQKEHGEKSDLSRAGSLKPTSDDINTRKVTSNGRYKSVQNKARQNKQVARSKKVVKKKPTTNVTNNGITKKTIKVKRR